MKYIGLNTVCPEDYELGLFETRVNTLVDKRVLSSITSSLNFQCEIVTKHILY